MAQKPKKVEPGFFRDNWQLLVALVCMFFSAGTFYASNYYERQKEKEEDPEERVEPTNKIAIQNASDALAIAKQLKTEMDGQRQQFEQMQRDLINLRSDAQQLRYDVDAIPKPTPPPHALETLPPNTPPPKE